MLRLQLYSCICQTVLEDSKLRIRHTIQHSITSRAVQYRQYIQQNNRYIPTSVQKSQKATCVCAVGVPFTAAETADTAVVALVRSGHVGCACGVVAGPACSQGLAPWRWRVAVRAPSANTRTYKNSLTDSVQTLGHLCQVSSVHLHHP